MTNKGISEEKYIWELRCTALAAWYKGCVYTRKIEFLGNMFLFKIRSKDIKDNKLQVEVPSLGTVEFIKEN